MPPSPGLALAWLRVIFRWRLNKCLNEGTHQCTDRSLANAVTLGTKLVVCLTNCITPLQAGKSRGSFPPWIPGHPLKDHKGPLGGGCFPAALARFLDSRVLTTLEPPIHLPLQLRCQVLPPCSGSRGWPVWISPMGSLYSASCWAWPMGGPSRRQGRRRERSQSDFLSSLPTGLCLPKVAFHIPSP